MPGVKKSFNKPKEKKTEPVKKVEIDLTDMANVQCKFIGKGPWTRRDLRTAYSYLNKQYKKWQRKQRKK